MRATDMVRNRGSDRSDKFGQSSLFAAGEGLCCRSRFPEAKIKI